MYSQGAPFLPQSKVGRAMAEGRITMTSKRALLPRLREAKRRIRDHSITRLRLAIWILRRVIAAWEQSVPGISFVERHEGNTLHEVVFTAIAEKQRSGKMWKGMPSSAISTIARTLVKDFTSRTPQNCAIGELAWICAGRVLVLVTLVRIPFWVDKHLLYVDLKSFASSYHC